MCVLHISALLVICWEYHICPVRLFESDMIFPLIFFHGHPNPIHFHPLFPGTTLGRMLKMLSNILVGQCLTIVQSVLILIGALKKAGSGAVDGVVDRYCLIFLYYLSNKYAHMTFYMLYADTTCLFHRSEMSTVQIMIQISFATIQLLFTLFLSGM